MKMVAINRAPTLAPPELGQGGNLGIFYSVFCQFGFLLLVLAVQIGLVALCMIASHSVLIHFHASRLWIKILLLPLTVCFAGFVYGIYVYLQPKYDLYKKRKRSE